MQIMECVNTKTKPIFISYQYDIGVTINKKGDE